VYRVEVRRLAQRGLDKLPRTDFEAVIQSISNLAETPRPRGMEKVKNTGLWRIRHGDYRITYAIDDDSLMVTIVRVGHRREIYRAL
jgi:mRNA interferase RelE/StbE